MKTWVFKTNEKGIVYFLDKYKISGDEIYKNKFGDPTIPLGTISIQETKAPQGYLLNEEVFIRNIISNEDMEIIDTYNAPTIPEQIKRGDFEFDKKAFDTQRAGG